MKAQEPLFLTVIIAGASLLVSLLSGLNQVWGFFSKITLLTAILSIILAIIIAFIFPYQIQSKWPTDRLILNMTPGRFCLVLALLIFLIGVGPYSIKFVLAENIKSKGIKYFNKHRYSPARIHLSRSIQYFEKLGHQKTAAKLKIPLIQTFAALGDYSSAESLIKKLEDSPSIDEHMQGKLYVARGILEYALGHFEQTERYYQLAHQTIETNSREEAILLQNEAVLWSERGQLFYNRVIKNYQKARDIYKSFNDVAGLIHIYINEGNLYAHNPKKARSLYEQALVEAEKLKDSYLFGTIHLNIGKTHRQHDNLEDAAESYKEALLNFEKAADFLGQSEVMQNIATVEWVRGRKEIARQFLNKSEAYTRNIDLRKEGVHPRKIAQFRTFQADIYDSFGDSDKAEELYKEALSIFSQNPSSLKEANTLINYGALLLRLGRSEEAKDKMERAREILNYYEGEFPCLASGVLNNNMGKAYQDIFNLENALNYYQKSSQIFKDIGERLLYAEAVENIGIIRNFKGDNGTEEIEEALGIYRKVGNPTHEVGALFNLYSMFEGSSSEKKERVDNILDLIKKHKIDMDTEAAVYFGIEPDDIGDKKEIIIFRERLQQLTKFFQKLNEPIQIGRSLLQIAKVEMFLRNIKQMREYAAKAEPYVDIIPMPARISFHSTLGACLIEPDRPQKGLEHYWKAFELSQGIPKQQRAMATAIQLNIMISKDYLDRQKYRKRIKRALQQTKDPFLRVILIKALEDLGS